VLFADDGVRDVAYDVFGFFDAKASSPQAQGAFPGVVDGASLLSA
jgi:hypothetical protein